MRVNRHKFPWAKICSIRTCWAILISWMIAILSIWQHLLTSVCMTYFSLHRIFTERVQDNPKETAVQCSCWFHWEIHPCFKTFSMILQCSMLNYGQCFCLSVYSAKVYNSLYNSVCPKKSDNVLKKGGHQEHWNTSNGSMTLSHWNTNVVVL